MEQIPVVGGTAVFVAGVIVGLFRWLLQHEIQLLRQQVTDQTKRITQLEVLYDEQRTEKHALGGQLGQAQMLMATIIVLAEKCTCGALEVVKDLMARAPTPFMRQDTD